MVILSGVDLEQLTETAETEEDTAQGRAAARELAALERIASYHQQARSEIQRPGNVFYVPIPHIHCPFLTVEKARLTALLYGNRRLSYNYAGIRVGITYRCPIPGCGVAIYSNPRMQRTGVRIPS